MSAPRERFAGPGRSHRPGFGVAAAAGFGGIPRDDDGDRVGPGPLLVSRGALRWYLGGAFALI